VQRAARRYASKAGEHAFLSAVSSSASRAHLAEKILNSAAKLLVVAFLLAGINGFFFLRAHGGGSLGRHQQHSENLESLALLPLYLAFVSKP
jgi:hypothetical protein